MKKETKKQKLVLLCSLAMVMLAVGFAGCKDDPPVEDIAKDQSANITPFEGKTITVKGVFTNAEWGVGTTSIPSKIEIAIKKHIEIAPNDNVKNILISRYNKCTTIHLEKTSAYINWKTIGDGETIYINFNVLDSADLWDIIGKALESMDVNATAHE